jgi:hypothetical protein
MNGNSRKTQRGRNVRAGQTMIEYVIIAAVLIAALSVAGVLIYALRSQSDRTLELVSSDYP